MAPFKAWLCFDRSKVFEPSYLTHTQLASQTSVNTVLAIGAQWHSTITSGNVPAAYVQAELPDNDDTTYYMSQPQGFEHPEHPDWVCKLNKALYGHPCTGQVWLTRSYDLVVGTFDVFWDLFQVLFSGFISGSEGWGVQVRVGFLSMF